MVKDIDTFMRLKNRLFLFLQLVQGRRRDCDVLADPIDARRLKKIFSIRQALSKVEIFAGDELVGLAVDRLLPCGDAEEHAMDVAVRARCAVEAWRLNGDEMRFDCFGDESGGLEREVGEIVVVVGDELSVVAKTNEERLAPLRRLIYAHLTNNNILFKRIWKEKSERKREDNRKASTF